MITRSTNQPNLQSTTLQTNRWEQTAVCRREEGIRTRRKSISLTECLSRLFAFVLKKINQQAKWRPEWKTNENLFRHFWVYLKVLYDLQWGVLPKYLWSAFKSTWDHTQIFIDLTFRLVSEVAQWSLTQLLDKSQMNDHFVKRQIDFPSCVFSTFSNTYFRNADWLQQSWSSSLICKQVGTGVGFGTALELAELQVEPGKCPFGSFDKKTLKSFLSHHQHY